MTQGKIIPWGEEGKGPKGEAWLFAAPPWHLASSAGAAEGNRRPAAAILHPASIPERSDRWDCDGGLSRRLRLAALLY